MLAQDLRAPFDPTGYVNLSAAQILQLVSGIKSNLDRGFCLYSTDAVNGNPVVPDARDNAVPDFQRYLWIRQGASTIVVYAWNKLVPNNDVSLLNWHPITGLIGPQEVLTANIADGAVTDAKVSDVDYSKISNAPDLTNIIPPDNSISTNKLQANVVTASKIADGNVTPSKLANGGGALQLVRINNAGIFEFFTPNNVVNLANAVIADRGKLVSVNSGNNDLGYIDATSVGRVLQSFAVSDKTAYSTTNATGLTDDGTLPTTAFGIALPVFDIAITPKSTISKIIIEGSINVGTQNASNNVLIALFDGQVNAIGAWNCIAPGATGTGTINFVFSQARGSTAPITYSLRFMGFAGGSGTFYVNSTFGKASTGDMFGGVWYSTLRVTEVL